MEVDTETSVVFGPGPFKLFCLNGYSGWRQWIETRIHAPSTVERRPALLTA